MVLQVRDIGVSNFSVDYIKGITRTGLEMPVSPLSSAYSAKICLQIIASL